MFRTKKEFNELTEAKKEINRLESQLQETTIVSTKMLNDLKLQNLKKDYEIVALKAEVSDAQQKVNKLKNDTQSRNLEALEKTNNNLRLQIKELQSASDKYTNEDLNNQIKNLKKDLQYKDDLLTRYQELPDIKRLMTSISDMKMPTMEDLKGVLNLYNSETVLTSIAKMNTTIQDLSRTIQYTVENLRYRQ